LPIGWQLCKEAIQGGNEITSLFKIPFVQVAKLEHQYAHLFTMRSEGCQERLSEQISIQEIGVGLACSFAMTCMLGDLATDLPLTIADGYHRVCASYYLDENAEVTCHIVDLK